MLITMAISKLIATMIKQIKNLMLVAVAAMGFVSCQNEAVEEVIRPQEVVMTIIADADDTRTVIDETNNRVNWSEGDALKVIENSATYRTTTAINIDSNGKAQFTVSFPANTEATSFTYNAIYPASAVVEDDADKVDAERVKVIVKNTQNPTTTSFDPTADILVSKHIETEAQPTELNMQFKRLVALGKMTLKGLPASSAISNVTFTVDSENVKALAGRNYVNTVAGEVLEYGYYGDTKSITMNYDEPLTTNNIYFACNPFEMEAGETFTVKVVCDNVSYSREVTIPEGRSLVFSEGELNTFTVDMTNAKVEVISGISLPWNESFDSEDLSMYEIVDGGSATKVYPDDNLANGATKGEILIGKNGGSMTATIASDGKAKTLNLWFKSNKDFIEVSSPTEGVTVTKITNVGYTINLAIGVNTFKVKFTNNNKSNARVDDIVVTEDAPFIESIVADGMNVLFSTGDEFAFNGTVIAIYTNGITEDVTNDVTVDSSAVNMSVAGTYTVTISYNNISTTYDILVQNASVQTKMVELETGTFANNTITWSIDGVTVVQAKGSGNTAVNSAYTTASTMRLYQGHTLTFSCDSNITKIEMVTKGSNYGKTATVDVGTLNNPKTDDCTITWTGSSNKIVLTNGTGSGGSQIQTSSIKITYEVSSETGGDDNGDEGDDATYTSYTEDFTPWTENSTSNTAAGTVVGNACEWAYKGASKQYWSNISEGSSLSFAITLLKPSSADATYVLSEVLHGGIKNLKLTARSNNTSTGVNIYVIDVKTNTTHKIGTLDTTAKKTDANGSYDLSSLNITGDYQIKIANKSTAAYCCIGGLSWNY